MVLNKINCRAQPGELESLKDDISSFSRGPLDRYDLDSIGFARLGLTRKRVALSILTFAVAGFVGILRWTFSPESIVTTVTPIPTSSDAVPEKLNLMMDKLERLGDQVERLVSSNLKEQTPDTAKNAQQTEVEKRLEKVVQGAKQWFDDTVSDKLQEINHTVVDMHQQLAQEARDIAEELDRKITTRLKSLEESIADRVEDLARTASETQERIIDLAHNRTLVFLNHLDMKISVHEDLDLKLFAALNTLNETIKSLQWDENKTSAHQIMMEERMKLEFNRTLDALNHMERDFSATENRELKLSAAFDTLNETVAHLQQEESATDEDLQQIQERMELESNRTLYALKHLESNVSANQDQDMKLSASVDAFNKTVVGLQSEENRTDARLQMLENEHIEAGSFSVLFSPPKHGWLRSRKHEPEDHYRIVEFQAVFMRTPQVTTSISDIYSPATRQALDMKIFNVSNTGFVVKVTVKDFPVDMQVEWVASDANGPPKQKEETTFDSEKWFSD